MKTTLLEELRAQRRERHAAGSPAVRDRPPDRRPERLRRFVHPTESRPAVHVLSFLLRATRSADLGDPLRQQLVLPRPAGKTPHRPEHDQGDGRRRAAHARGVGDARHRQQHHHLVHRRQRRAARVPGNRQHRSDRCGERRGTVRSTLHGPEKRACSPRAASAFPS